jgi:tetratricopeptide (TPR) repeat protein
MQVTALPEQELLSNLSALKDSELLYERGIYPQSTYIFKHALTQEVVYDSILTKRKKSYHEKIARAMEVLYKENIDEKYELLSEHYIRSENYEKGAEYSRLVRKKALKTGTVIDGIAYAIKTVECLERLPKSDNILKEIVKARTILGFHNTQLNYHVEAKEAIDPIVDLALKSDDKRMQSQVLVIVGTYTYMVEEDFPKAIKYLEDALKLAQEVNDIASLILAEFWLGLGLVLYCEFEKGLVYFKKTRERSLAVKSLWSASIAESNIACFTYFFQGKLNDAFQHSLEAIRLAEESDDIYSKTVAYSTYAISCYGKGFLEEAKQNLLKGIDFAERLSYFIWLAANNLFLGEIYSEMGEYGAARYCYDKAILFSEESKVFRSWFYWSEIALAKAKVMSNGKNIKFDTLYNYVSQNGLRTIDGLLRRYVAEILIHVDNKRISDIEDWIKKAIELDERNGTLFSLGADYALYAKLFKQKGDIWKGKENLAKAIDIFKECGSDGWVKKYEEELASFA